MLIFDIIDESNSRYLISTSSDFDNEYKPEQQRESFKALIDQHPEKFAMVFESTDRRSTIYRINSAERSHDQEENAQPMLPEESVHKQGLPDSLH